MRLRYAAERRRRTALIRAQAAAAHAYAWVAGRLAHADRHDLKTDQAYVAGLYAAARARATDVACGEHRS